ncbi:hypothetical protein ALNOE001_15560 [Candidatus Methanobinarius endosymbioticus]|uniref:Uncharacterized protein n=1 Tax=Candidatus Methanobinarius endosymbioticus TaxID=2006182 RepID=A0A366M915_9EURY|nr:hypothetical protein ALNOE001_15560 [Candidatus Methanobinarius endosymbioticus]
MSLKQIFVLVSILIILSMTLGGISASDNKNLELSDNEYSNLNVLILIITLISILVIV